VTILDVGTGGADIPLALLERARARGSRWRIAGLDSRPEVLAAAALATPGLPTIDGLDLQLGDGRSLPFADRSFDVVHASLLVHHLTPHDVAALLREMARVARLGIVVNDLSRGWRNWLGAWLIGHLFTGNRYTRHDAPLSVRRAYLATEVATMIRGVDLAPVRTITGFLGHRYAIAAVPRTEDDGIGAGGMDGTD
jgi:ubiquinone/menaquinone biosynthesis C-methylase UbiE